MKKPVSVSRLNLTSGPVIQSMPRRIEHVALAPDLVVDEIVAKPIREHRLGARAQLDLPGGLDVFLRDAADRLGAQEDRALLERRAGARRRRRGRGRPLRADGGGVNCGAGFNAGSGVAAPTAVSAGVDCAPAGSDANAAASARATGVKRTRIDGSSCEDEEQPL